MMEFDTELSKEILLGAPNVRDVHPVIQKMFHSEPQTSHPQSNPQPWVAI